MPVPGLRPKSALTLSAGLAIYSICPAPSFASSPILARNARVFHYVRGSKGDRIPIVLRFERSGELRIELEVQSADSHRSRH